MISMKVSDTRNPVSEIIKQYEVNENAKPDAGKQANIALVPEEKVSLSAAAKEVQQVKSAIEALPDVRTEKVAQLKDRIEEGTYNVSGEKIAEKMIGDSLLDIIA
jgi:negative regulator of flagellin synthesis FlgM